MGNVIFMRKGEVHTAPVKLPEVGTPLNDFTWEQIAAVSKYGLANEYFSVGDSKTIVINGKIGATTFSNLSIEVFVIGINHNSDLEGQNRVHFQIGKINGTHVALCDSKYGQATSASGYFYMNKTTNSGLGWSNSEMYDVILGNTGTPDNVVANSFMAALPSELRSVMKPVVKYTDNSCSATNSASDVTASTDYLWLLSEFEVFGSQKYANQYEQSKQQQYDYYKAGNSKKVYKYDSTGTTVMSTLRSACYDVAGYFCILDTSGASAKAGADGIFTITPAFAI